MKKFYILLCCIIAVSAASISAWADEYDVVVGYLPDDVKADTVYRQVDVPPAYPGGTGGIMSFLAENLKYPTAAEANRIQGRVVVSFVVGTDGKVGRATVTEPVHPLLDAEALRVVGLLSGFTPGRKGGRPVKTWFVLPVRFALDDSPKAAPKLPENARVDSVAYKNRMADAVAAERDSNAYEAANRYLDAFGINPYDVEPLRRALEFNALMGDTSNDYEVCSVAIELVDTWNDTNGTSADGLRSTEWIAEKMMELKPDEPDPLWTLLKTYIHAPGHLNETSALMDRLIPLLEKREMWDHYCHLASLKSLMFDNYDEGMAYLGPMVRNLGKSSNSVGALLYLRRGYLKAGNEYAADLCSQIIDRLDPDGSETRHWEKER